VNELNRRNFLKKLSLASAVLVTSPALLLTQGCSTDKKSDVQNLDNYSALRVSSDIYKTDLMQRFAFAIYKGQVAVFDETLIVTLKDPAGSTTNIKNVKPRKSGLKTQGIYSFEHAFKTSGQYELITKYYGKEISLAFNVNETNVAPAIGSTCIASDSPTNLDPKDAKVLCTRFEGNCGLHNHTISDLLALNEPFIVMFATPARCQTSYCGPVLEILKDELSINKVNAVHIEIYKDETTDATIDTVSQWNLPSEPWLFAVNKSGEIIKRLDGAFDLSEIQEVIESVKQ
jgi:hypothetical protein